MNLSTTEMQAITKGLDKIDNRLNQELPELRDRLLTLEQRQSMATAPADLRTSVRRPEGEALVLRSADDFHRHYRGGDAEPVGLADFLRAVAGMKASEVAKKSLSVGVDTGGGFAVPRETAGRILGAMVPASTVLQAGAGVMPVGEAKTLTTAAINAIPTAAWRNEGENIAESEPTFRSIVTTPRSLAFRFKVTRELLADAPRMETQLQTVIAQAMAKAWDATALRGSGTAPEPRGIRNTSGVHIRTNGTNGATGPDWADLMDAYAEILAADCPAPNACIMSPRSWLRLFGATDLQGQPLLAPEPLRGLQFLVTSQIPKNITTGTSNDTTEVYLGNFGLCDFMMRESAPGGSPVTIQISDNDANTGHVTFIGHARGDFSVWYPAGFAVVTGLR